MNIKVGQRVLLTTEVALYPHILIPSGEKGTIVSIDGDDIHIEMETKYNELSEWENEVLFSFSTTELDQVPSFIDHCQII